MIPAKELRIGNWVNLRVKKGSWFGKVTAILDAEAIHIGDDIRAELRLIYPVPLTPYILEKCGFERHQTIKHVFVMEKMKFVGVAADSVDNCRVMLKGYSDPIRIKYLHQLQNLIHALTGQELNIVIKELQPLP